VIVDQPCLVRARQYLCEMEDENKSRLDRDGTPRWVEVGLGKVSGRPPVPGQSVGASASPSLLLYLDLQYGPNRP
jgi:hypothetical protein